MPGPIFMGTFATGANASTGGNTSDVLAVPTGMTTARLTITGLDASNMSRPENGQRQAARGRTRPRTTPTNRTWL